MLSGMSLPDKRWLAKTLMEQVKLEEAEGMEKWQKWLEEPHKWDNENRECYDKVFTNFNKDWGGDGDAL